MCDYVLSSSSSRLISTDLRVNDVDPEMCVESNIFIAYQLEVVLCTRFLCHFFKEYISMKMLVT